MKIGFVTGWNEDLFRFSKQAGFDGIELFIVGGDLIHDSISDDEIKKAREILDKIGVSVTSVFHFRNFAHPNAAEANAALKGFRRVMDIARGLGTDLVTCNAWVPVNTGESARMAFFKKTFGQFANLAEDMGMRIGIENCPHRLHNIAFSPVMWSRMWEEVPSKALGLEFDPSHLVFQQIDYIRAFNEHKDRIFAFHAKDLEIRYDVLATQGNLIPGWWRFRAPGLGDLDWKRMLVTIEDAGYNGPVILEMEDPIYTGFRIEEGLKFGLETLRRYIPQST